MSRHKNERSELRRLKGRVGPDSKSLIPAMRGVARVVAIKYSVALKKNKKPGPVVVAGKRKIKTAMVTNAAGSFYNPTENIARAIAEALNPDIRPTRSRSEGDMSPDEIMAIESEYKMKVIPSDPETVGVQIYVVRATRETAKAKRWLLPSGYFVWIPKSQTFSEGNGVIRVAPWITRKRALRLSPKKVERRMTRSEARDAIMEKRRGPPR